MEDAALLALRQVADAVLARAEHPELRREVAHLRSTLGEPLRLGVLGAVSAGKSTLVNGLLRIPAAPVGEEEKTRWVTVLTYGRDDGRLFVDGAGGTHETRLTPGGWLPTDLGMPDEEVELLRIELDQPILRRLTIIDTPGSDTTTAALQQRADRALRDHAQAVLFLSEHVSDADQETLDRFRRLCAGGEFGVSNAVLVLTKIDNSTVANPWPAARKRAARRLEQLRDLAFAAVPVAAAMAMTAGAELLTAGEITLLRRLARRSDDDLDWILADFTDDDPDLDELGPPADRARVLGRLKQYGLRVAIAALRADPTLSPTALHATLRAHSGFDGPPPGDDEPAGPVRCVADAVAVFARRADQLKALAAINRLRDLLTIPYLPEPDREVLLHQLRLLDEDPATQERLRTLRLTRALDAAARDRLPLPGERLAELVRLTTAAGRAERLGLPVGAAPAEVRAAASAMAAAWRARATVAAGSVAGRHLDHVLDVIEELAAPAAGEAPPVPVEATAEQIASLLAAPGLPPRQRAAVAPLVGGRSLGHQVGLDESADGPAISRRAAALAAEFRGLHATLGFTDRRTAEALTDTLETIWATTAAGGSS